jgi:hypothetical protein
MKCAAEDFPEKDLVSFASKAARNDREKGRAAASRPRPLQNA